jgi:hypothetical protein
VVTEEQIVRRIAETIWAARGAIPRLLDERQSRKNSHLRQQQEQCWKEARAVYAALEEDETIIRSR